MDHATDGHAMKEAVFQTPNGRPAVFRYREDTNDWNTLWACLNEDEYGLRGLSGVRSAVDVGGYLGGVGIGLALDHPDARVLIIEPVPDNVDLIDWAIDANHVRGRVEVLAGAVGDGSEIEVWYGYRGNEAAEHHAFVGNSTLAYDTGGPLEHDTVRYVSLTIRDVVDRMDPDLLKIDTEGAEWAFLARDAALLPRIVGEWHPVRRHTRSEFADLLAASHHVTFTGPEAGPGGFEARRIA